jgi:hypothetical protein
MAGPQLKRSWRCQVIQPTVAIGRMICNSLAIHGLGTRVSPTADQHLPRTVNTVIFRGTACIVAEIQGVGYFCRVL